MPVLVKASYFPNWNVSGAKGPYRVAPNQMVVIPTSNQVSLHNGHTGVVYLSYLQTLVGIAGLVYLWRKGRIDYGPRLDPAPALSAPPGLDDVSDWTPPEPAEAITFLIDWDEDDIEPAPEPDTNLPPPEVGEHEPEDQMSRPPPG